MSEFARIFVDYLMAAFWHWWVGIVLAVLGLISAVEWISSWKILIPLWAKIAFLLVVVSVAQFLAYYDLKVKSAEKNMPELTGTIEQVVLGDSPDLDVALAFLLITVRNVGAPTIAEGFRLSIKTQELDLLVNPTFIPDGFTLRGVDGKPIAIFNRDDAIYEKTVKPIVRGSLARGWLRYDLEGLRAEQIRRTGAKWTIHFQDVFEQPYTTPSIDMAGGPSGVPQYFPGAEQPFKRLIDKEREKKKP